MMTQYSNEVRKDLEDEIVEICGNLMNQGHPSKEIASCFHAIAETIELFDPFESAEF